MKIVLAMLLVLASQEPAATSDNGTVDGIVLRYGTGQPIPETQVFLTANTLANSVGTVTTDVSGRFSFSEVPPGQYAVVARRDGYFASGGSGRSDATFNVTLAKKEHRSNVTLNLIPGSTISGRLIAPNGRPATGIAVEAVQSGYDRMGRHTLTSAVSVNTDDRGEYRIFWLAPGDYYVRVATQRSGSFGGRGNNRGQTSPRVSTYYPGTDIVEAASAISVQADDSVSGIDFRYDAAPTGYTISGTVDVTLPNSAPQTGITGVYLMPHRFSVIEGGVPTPMPGAIVQGTVVDTLNQPVPGAAVTLVPEPSKRGIAFRYGSATTDKDGHFTIRSIAPGDYKIFAMDFGTNFIWMNPDHVAKYESSGTPVVATTAKPSEVSLTLIPLDNRK